MVSTGRSRASSWTVIVWDSSRPSAVGDPGSVMVQSEALDDGSPTSEAPEDASTTSEALDDASPTHVVRRRFSAAPPDRLTTLLVGFTVSIMGALALDPQQGPEDCILLKAICRGDTGPHQDDDRDAE